MKQWTRLRHGRLSISGVLALALWDTWYQALFEGIVEIANTRCTAQRPACLQLDIVCIPSVNMAEW